MPQARVGSNLLGVPTTKLLKEKKPSHDCVWGTGGADTLFCETVCFELSKASEDDLRHCAESVRTLGELTNVLVAPIREKCEKPLLFYYF